mgnify:FL=1
MKHQLENQDIFISNSLKAHFFYCAMLKFYEGNTNCLHFIILKQLKQAMSVLPSIMQLFRRINPSACKSKAVKSDVKKMFSDPFV